eukprot:GGOE01041689.1.p1 GENE.GGOE01041689.1~~GGOE01041689.1.p1  ORF type:complete len:347 (+),score=86.49 GGOE01041689.1:43-1041(+)
MKTGWHRHGGCAVCLLYCACGATLSLLNGWLFLKTPMKFPWTMTLCHMVCMFSLVKALAACKLQYVELQEVPEDSPRFGMPLLGMLTAANIGLNNSSLLFINAAMNQLIKALMPLSIAIISGHFLRRQHEAKVWFGYIFIAVGVVLTCFNNPNFNSTGVLLCLGSLAAGSFQLTAAEAFLQGFHFNPFSYVSHTSMWSALTLAPFALAIDVPVFLEQVARDRWGTGLAVVSTSVMAFLNTILLCATVAMTSSTFAGVSGNVKVVVVVLLQHAIWPSDTRVLHTHHLIGALTTVVCYCYLSLLQFSGKVNPDPVLETAELPPLEAVEIGTTTK